MFLRNWRNKRSVHSFHLIEQIIGHALSVFRALRKSYAQLLPVDLTNHQQYIESERVEQKVESGRERERKYRRAVKHEVKLLYPGPCTRLIMRDLFAFRLSGEIITIFIVSRRSTMGQSIRTASELERRRYNREKKGERYFALVPRAENRKFMRLDRAGRYPPGERGCASFYLPIAQPSASSPLVVPTCLSRARVTSHPTPFLSPPPPGLRAVSPGSFYFAKSILLPRQRDKTGKFLPDDSRTSRRRTNEDERDSAAISRKRHLVVRWAATEPLSCPFTYLSTRLTAKNEIYPARNAFYAAYGCIHRPFLSAARARARALLSNLAGTRAKGATRAARSRAAAAIDLRASTLQAMNSEKPVGAP